MNSGEVPVTRNSGKACSNPGKHTKQHNSAFPPGLSGQLPDELERTKGVTPVSEKETLLRRRGPSGAFVRKAPNGRAPTLLIFDVNSY